MDRSRPSAPDGTGHQENSCIAVDAETHSQNTPDDNNNQLVPVFRKFIKRYVFGVVLFAIALVSVLIIEAIFKWNARPSWIAKVPCVIQPQVKPVEDVLKSIERYFLLTDMVPPVATAIFLAVHVVTSLRKTDREYTPPQVLPVVSIWAFKILAPLMIFMFINVKDDVFVKYDALAQTLCETSVSLTFYPPGTTGGITNGVLEEMKEKQELNAEQMSKLGNLVADNSFSVSKIFSDLRNVTRLYFMNKKNRFYSSEAFGGDTDWDFESELAAISVNVLTESDRRSGNRRAGDGEWWKAESNWKEPERMTCRRDVKPINKAVKGKPKKDGTTGFQFAKLKDSKDGCMVGLDPDSHVYDVMEEFLDPPTFAVKFCQKGMRAAKKRFGYNSGEASAWTIKQVLDHLINIITGQSFSYTFCDAETALIDKFFYGTGVRDAGMSAYVKSTMDDDYYMKCEWILNDNNDFSEIEIGKEIASKEECLTKVKTDVRCTSMTIANYRSEGGVCKCQKGADMREDAQSPAVSCWLSSILTKDEAKRAASLQISDICTEFARKPKNIASLTPGALRWLDPQDLSQASRRAPIEFIEKLNLNVDVASNTTNVDLCDTHMHNSSVVSMFCLLLGIKDPQTGVNALSAQMCPQIIRDLDLAETACRNIPDVPASKVTAGARGRKITKKARCQVEFANGKSGERLADRIRSSTADQLVKSTSFMKLLPQNYTSLSILVERMSQGLFSPEKEASRVGAPAEPRDFNKNNNPLPPGAALQHSAGRCLGINSQSIDLEYILSPDETDILGTRVKIPDEFLKKTGVGGLPDKLTLNFTGMSHEFCWNTCRKFYKDTIAIDGPSVRPPKYKQCKFPFTDGKKKYWSCIPDNVRKTNMYQARRRNAPGDDTGGYGYGEDTGAVGYDSGGGNDAGDSGIGGNDEVGSDSDGGNGAGDSGIGGNDAGGDTGFTEVPFEDVDNDNNTCISKEEFDNSTYQNFFDGSTYQFKDLAGLYQGECTDNEISPVEFEALAFFSSETGGGGYETGGAGYGYGYAVDGTEGGGGTAGSDGTEGGGGTAGGEDRSNYVECMITFASPLTPDQQINVKQCYARQAGVPFGNVEMTAAMRRDSEYKVTVRANDASVLAQVKTKLQDMRKLTAAIVATGAPGPTKIVSPETFTYVPSPLTPSEPLYCKSPDNDWQECRLTLPEDCICQDRCAERDCDGSTPLVKEGVEMGFCRDKTYLRWMERFGKRDAKSSMLAAVKYMQEVVKNEGAAILKLMEDLVEEEQSEVLELAPQFIRDMLGVELGMGGTCVTDPTTNEAIGCTSQMRAFGLCECLTEAQLLQKLQSKELKENYFKNLLYFLLLPFKTSRKGKSEILEKEDFDPGCRSSGNVGSASECWTNYTVTEYGVVKAYGKQSCFFDSNKDPKCLQKSLTAYNTTTYDLANYDKSHWNDCVCRKFVFPSGTAIKQGVAEAGKFLKQVLLDIVNSAQIMLLQATREFSEKIVATMAGATNKISYLIGILIGLQSTIQLVPFALAILSGVTKGFGLYMDMTQDSGIADSIMDLENLSKAVVTVVAVATTVFVLPGLIIVIFIFQGFANYSFILAVLGVAILLLGKIFWLVYNAGAFVPESWVFNCGADGMCTRCNKNEGDHVARQKKAQGKGKGKVMDAIEGDANKKDEEKYCAIMTPFQKYGPILTNVLALGLLVAGFVAWFIQDQQLFMFAMDWGAKKLIDFFLGRTGIWIWKFVANMGYNFFFSALATVIICSKILGWIFKGYHLTMYRQGTDASGNLRLRPSNLWKINLHQRNLYEDVVLFYDSTSDNRQTNRKT